MNTPRGLITDNGAIELSWRLVMVISLLLGFNAHSILSNVIVDYRALLKKTKWPEKVTFGTARLLGITFLTTSLVILELPANVHMNCNSNTRLAILAFFVSHGMHHFQSAIRLLSLYGYRWDMLVLQMAACIVILGLCIFAAVDSRSGVVLPSNGCVLLFDWSTLPDRTSLLILAGLSVCHQAITSLLAITKLYEKPDWKNKDGTPRSIYTALMVDGIPYWIARSFSVPIFFLIPIAFFAHHTLLVMTAFAIHTAADVELSALILRSSPVSRRDNRRSSFGILDDAGVQTETKSRSAISIASRLSGMNLFAKYKKEQHASEVSRGNAMAATTDCLPQYHHRSLSSREWKPSDSTLLAKTIKAQEAPRSKTFDSALTHTAPPTRPPRTASTRISRSLQKVLSSTSRYASVIHFYQDSPAPTPDPIQNSKWTVTPIPPDRPSSIGSRGVKATPPPGWI